MHLQTHFLAAFLAFTTIASADVGCGRGYCPCVIERKVTKQSCYLGFCANTYPPGTHVPNCYPGIGFK
ncbi:hypothetical protein Vi05172_g897 [Venturia inaequalis]|nr:hypothetical protein Vi05172_g897 [Venturia inaequalis]